MKLCIFVFIVFAAVVSANFKVLYHRVYGNTLSGMLPSFLAKVTSNNAIVGVRGLYYADSIEPLTSTWMTSKSYSGGYSYYEKIVVIDVYARQLSELQSFWDIPGPLHAGSKLTVKFMMPDPIDVFELNLIDHNYPLNIFHHYTIDNGQEIRTDKLINGAWQNVGLLIYTDPATMSGVLTFFNEIQPDQIVCTLNGMFPTLVPSTPPGNTAMKIEIKWKARSPYIYWIKYEQ